MNDTEARPTAGSPVGLRPRVILSVRAHMSAFPTIAPDFVTEAAQLRRAALFVDKILDHAKPAEHLVERASKFDLVISHRTANAFGITIAPTVLVHTDQVIE